jgi:hypothetical protein
MSQWPFVQAALLFGTRVAETILASGHVRPHTQAGHMIASDPIKSRAQHLAGRGPFSNRASFVNSLLSSSVAVPGSRFSPRSEGSAATSGSKHRRCNVHSGLAWCVVMRPKALRRSRLHPRPVGQLSSDPTPGWILLMVSSGGRRLLGPAEGLAGTPDAVHDHREFPRKRDPRLAST